MLTGAGHFETIWDLNLQAKKDKERAGPSIISRCPEAAFSHCRGGSGVGQKNGNI